MRSENFEYLCLAIFELSGSESRLCRQSALISEANISLPSRIKLVLLDLQDQGTLPSKNEGNL